MAKKTRKSKIKVTSPLLMKLGGTAVYSFINNWMSTMHLRGYCVEPINDPANPLNHQPGIYILWHEYLSVPFYLRGHCNITMLVSMHRDAEWLSFAAKHQGFGTVRGSSTRGGVSALKELFRRSQKKHLTITPDGPRGPRRKMAPGPIFLSSKLQIPLIPLGFGCDRPWRLRTWDRFAVARPFSHVRSIIGASTQIPADLDRDGIEHYRLQMEDNLNQVTKCAEDWAESRQKMEGDFFAKPKTNRLFSNRASKRFEPHWQRLNSERSISSDTNEKIEDSTTSASDILQIHSENPAA